MVKLRCFRGHLANQHHVGRILSHAYDVVNTAEAAEECKDNPMSFYHVCKPEIDLPGDVDQYDDRVYEKGYANLLDFIEKDYLVEDSTERLYIYQQTLGEHTQQGILGLASMDDYENKRIKRHEYTLPKKEKDRTRLCDTQNANAEPVFLAFKHNQEVIKARIKDISLNTEPYADVTTTSDGVRHVLWRCTVEDSQWFQTEFEDIPHTYVADGHHRTAAACNVGRLRRERAIEAGHQVTGEEPFNFFMALHYPADNLLVMDYNRVIKDLNGLSSEQFLERLTEHFEVEILPHGESTHPGGIHKMTLLLDGKWYKLTMKDTSVDTTSPCTQIDSHLLTALVLTPLLNITDIKNDPRIDFVGGMRGHKELERRCKEDCVAAFAMHPCEMSELIGVADASEIMPPKTTWFEPKPRSGLVVRRFEEPKKH